MATLVKIVRHDEDTPDARLLKVVGGEVSVKKSFTNLLFKSASYSE